MQVVSIDSGVAHVVSKWDVSDLMKRIEKRSLGANAERRMDGCGSILSAAMRQQAYG